MQENRVLGFNVAYDIIKSGDKTAFIKAFTENSINITEKNKDGYSLVDAAAESKSVEMLRTVLGFIPETSERQLKEKENLMKHAFTHIIYPKKSHSFKLSDSKAGEEMRIFFTEMYREVSAKHTDAFLAEIKSPLRKRKPKI